MRIPRSEEEFVAVCGEPAVLRPTLEVGRDSSTIPPNLPARSRVNGPRISTGARDVQHVVDEQRRCLKTWSEGGLERPLRFELTDVLWRDLRQRAVTMPEVVPVMNEPLGTVARKAGEQILIRHQRRTRLLCRERH